MTTLRKYLDVVKAEMDKSLLEAAGIPAFIAGENSASIGYGGSIAEVHLQVQDTDVDQARQVLQDNQEVTPLSDDFIPTESPPTEAPQLEIARSSSTKAVLSVVVTVVVAFGMIAAFTLWKASHTPADPDRAIAVSDKTIELNPRNASAYYNRGLAKRTKGDLDGAIADFDKAIELNPTYAQAYNNRGSAKRAKDDLDGALADFNKAIELDPKNVNAYVNRSSVKWTKGDLDSAIIDCDHAMELDPKNINACITCGSTKGIKGDLDGAIADYDRVIALNPKDARGYSGRGAVKRAKGDLDGALADCDKAIELNPRKLGDYYNRAVIRYDKRDWSNAVADFRKASTMKLTDSKSDDWQDDLHIRIWLARARLGERNAAMDEMKQYLSTRTVGKPGDSPSTIVRFLIGDVSEDAFLKAANSGDEKQTQNQRSVAFFYAGTLRLLDSDKSTAADYFKKCLETGVKNLGVHVTAAAELEALRQ